jgi:hypothetical protein
MKNRLKPFVKSRSRQKGALTLVITLIVLLAMSIGSYALINTTTLESRMTSNDVKGRQAMQAAQSGIDFLIAGLSTVSPDREYLCNEDTYGKYRFRLEFGSGEDCDEVPFEIVTRLDKVRSIGYSEDGQSVRIIESTIDLTTPWNFGAPAGVAPGGPGAGPIVSAKNVFFQGTPEAALCDLGGTGGTQCTDLARSGNQSGIIEGTLVRAGGTISSGGNIPMGSENLVQNDTSISSLTADQLFSAYAGAGLTREQFKDATTTYKLSSTGGKLDPDQITTDARTSQNIYVDGGLTLRNGVLGSPERPVVLYVNGDLNLAGNVIIWGVVYATNADFSTGTNKIMGSLVSENNVSMNGNAAVYYNANLRPDPASVDPDTLVATGSEKLTSVRIGSWRELYYGLRN